MLERSLTHANVKIGSSVRHDGYKVHGDDLEGVSIDSEFEMGVDRSIDDTKAVCLAGLESGLITRATVVEGVLAVYETVVQHRWTRGLRRTVKLVVRLVGPIAENNGLELLVIVCCCGTVNHHRTKDSVPGLQAVVGVIP